MDQVTQENAALVEEADAASKALQGQAAQLVQVVSTFKLDAHAPVDDRISAGDRARGSAAASEKYLALRRRRRGMLPVISALHRNPMDNGFAEFSLVLSTTMST